MKRVHLTWFVSLLAISPLCINCGGDTAVNTSNDQVVVIPNAPSDLAGEVITGPAIRVTFVDNSDNEEGFRVERRTVTLPPSGTWQDIETLAADSDEYVDETVSSNTLYQYRVVAYNEVGDSIYPKRISVHVPDEA